MNFIYSHDSVFLSIEHDSNSVETIQFTSPQSPMQASSYGVFITEQLNAYFTGKLKNFDIKFRYRGSPFRQDVLRAIADIDYGSTVSYKELAERAGHPGAYRAAGTVCQSNDIVLVIPCHRVIKSNGDTGRFGAGPSLKKRLLEWEKHNTPFSMQ